MELGKPAVHDFSLLSAVGCQRRKALVSDKTKGKNPQIQPHLIYLQDIDKGNCYLPHTIISFSGVC